MEERDGNMQFKTALTTEECLGEEKLFDYELFINFSIISPFKYWFKDLQNLQLKRKKKKIKKEKKKIIGFGGLQFESKKFIWKDFDHQSIMEVEKKNLFR